MEEFRRSYEYEDESGVAGFLLIFLLSLISFDLVAAVVLCSQSGMVIRAFTDLSIVHLGVWLAYFAFKLVFVVMIFTKKKMVISFAKAFLYIRLGLFAVFILTVYLLVLSNPAESPLRLSDELSTAWKITSVLCLGPLLYTLLFSIGWLYYFKRSTRVQEFYRL